MKLTRSAWESIGKQAGWRWSQKHPMYDDDVMVAMEEVQKFIKEHGVEELRKVLRKWELTKFRLEDKPAGWE